MDFGGVTEVAGVTSFGSSLFCRPLDHSVDASVYYNAAWIQGEIGADPATSCGGIGPVGTPSAVVVGNGGTLSLGHLSDSFTVDVSAAASVLRFALNGQYNGTFNPDFYVKQGSTASPSNYDCKSDGTSMFGSCAFDHPTPGTWSIYVADAAGAGEYQLSTTILAPTASACGNGALDTGEQCDDGTANGTADSCCSAICTLKPSGSTCADDRNPCTLDECDGASSVCQHPAGNAGVICRAPLDACDAPETCDGASPTCPADARVPDSDGDGTCDATDPCTNVGRGQDFVSIPHPKLVIGKINTETTAGNDNLTLVAAFHLALGDSFAALDPSSRGARLILQDSTASRTLLDVTLPAGVFAGRHTRGWASNRLHTTWTFKDGTSAPLNGVTRMLIKNLSQNGPREVSVTVASSKSTYAVVAGDEPVRAIVVLGNQTDSAAGNCGESAFAAGDCRYNRAGSTLTCKH
jgi:hypothetical protein